MTNNTTMPPPHEQRHPIPPDFFTNLSKHDPLEEKCYAYHRERLQSSLNLPAKNRWVADWLFTDLENPFHKNIAVPPESFDSSLPMEIMHHFFDVELPACPFLRMKHKEKSTSSKFHSKGANLLLLPVASTNGITVGYSFGSVRAPPSQIEKNAFCGRFAFENARQELLVVSNGDQPGVPEHAEKLMIMLSFLWTPQAVREHYMMICPMREYSYFNLPNEILFFTSAEMHIPSKRPVPMDILALQNLFSDDSPPDLIDEMLRTSPTSDLSPEREIPTHEEITDLFQLPSASSELPWFLDSTGTPPDNVGIPRHPGGIETSSGAFNMDSLSESLAAIENSLRGDFYGSRQSMDLLHPLAQAHPVKTPGMASARNVVARITRSDRPQGEYLRDYAIRMYLRSVLPIASDVRFINHPTERALAQSRHPVVSFQQPSQVRARKIAPLPLVTSSGESEGASPDPVNDEERRKEEKREAKRRRNRLSAARSNEKRRENWQMQQRTLAALRKQVQELEGRKAVLTTENQVLKDQLIAGPEY